MEKTIYLVRHCSASGQESDAPLTEEGFKQAKVLSEYFSGKKIDRIVSSPFLRAVQTIKPLSQKQKVEIQKEDLLTERVLSSNNMPDWLDKLKETFGDPDLAFEGGESAREATQRIVNVVEGCLEGLYTTSVLVTHGNLLALLIKHFNPEFGFEDWRKLSNPDIFVLTGSSDKPTIKRIWKEK